MRKPAWFFATLLLTAASAQAQQAPSIEDGPLNIAPQTAQPAPRPLPDGSYPDAPGVTPPKILQAATAVYPAEELARARRACMIALTIDANGAPANISVFRSAGESFDAAAVKAVASSKFQPGSLNGRPVPVAIHIRVLFDADQDPAIPVIVRQAQRNPGDTQAGQTPPAVLHSADPEYSDEARRAKIKGVVIVSLLVDADGLPTDIRVVRSLGHGLDEKAIECVSKYRFRPAQKDGRPVPTRINIEVNFQLF